MSDGALSQDEIDALLAGVDSSGSGGAAAAAPEPSGGSEEDRRALQDFFAGTVGSLSSNLSTMTGADVSIRGPQVEFSNRDAFLRQLPDMVTAVKADFNSGFPGEHSFIISEDTAKSIASLMNKEENIQLDEMAMSVIGEVVSQMVGTQITALTQKTGNKSIASMSPEAANVPKAVAAMPGGAFIAAAYQLNLGDGSNRQIWEILGSSVSADIARALKGPAAAPPPSPAAMPSFGGAAIPSGGALPGMGGGPLSGMGGMNIPPMGQPTNVQSIQFPSLIPQLTTQEQGNISLLMDVYMEMTVELGRTRKLIKEILGMGEGTIIELDKLAGEPVDILVNHKLIAKGEVVVIDENFGVRVTEIVSPMERMNDLS
ncbi:MAG: flagellar motor switch protein FliN [Spirochaetaceae bacterium]|jgi:flagellar motor switch protein FliN/FliY|nr:flagellar motor switch protein FliN [Spirochaetaceae bacterium]